MENPNMKIKIYEQEIRDGLYQAISNNSIACCAVAESFEPSPETVEKMQKIMASSSDKELAVAENKNQIDLYYIKSILVSTGWNKNDDVFDSRELWNAKDTPEDKPFNFMHNEKDIIGHITANEVVDFDGNRITSDTEEVPNEFNILTSAVIYTSWSDPEQRERMRKIIAEIEENKWFVSMECLFPNFDYALRSSKGEMKVIKRNEASAFLTKHLRSYGGDGKYEDYQVGRLLRNLSFSGKGLVSKPANPRSIILEGNDFFDESQAQTLSLSSLQENDMSDILTKQVEDLRAELAEAKAANEALKQQVAQGQQAEFEATIKSLENTIAEQNEKLQKQIAEAQTLSESLKQAEEAIAMKDKEMKEKMEEMKQMKKKETMSKRKAQLEEAGLDAEDATSTAAEFENLDDETFDKVVAAMMMKKKAVMKNKMMKEEAKKPAKADDVDAAEATDEILDAVEAPSGVAIAEAVVEDSVQNLRAVATEWIGSVLKYNK
jgi:hypothetical protein